MWTRLKFAIVYLPTKHGVFTLIISFPVTWLDFTPSWCTRYGRKKLSKEAVLKCDSCMRLCVKLNPYCKAVEWWTNAGGLCFECTRPSWMTQYRDSSDLANPPHVFIEKRGQIVMKDIIGCGYHWSCIPRGATIWKGRGCQSEILNWIRKGNQSGRGSTFFSPLKGIIFLDKDILMQCSFGNVVKIYTFLYISSRATLKETFTAKYNGVLPRTP